jgi:uncharacterized protein (TIGR02271 family)
VLPLTTECRITLMDPTADREHDETTRYGEELRIDSRTAETGTVRVHKEVTTARTSAPIARSVEDIGNVERVAAHPQDSGQIEELEDGSISIPILEEQLVVTKRVVVRERVIVRKRVTMVHEEIAAELRTEHVTIEPVDQDRK